MKPDKPTSRERVEHVIGAITRIQRYCEKHSLESFLADQMTIDACLYQYTIIGEATAAVDSAMLEKYDYPWYKVKSFRNFVLHEYHAVEMRVIWDTTTEILPELKKTMEEILVNEF